MGLELPTLAAIVVTNDLSCVKFLSSNVIRVGMVDVVPPRKTALVCASRSLFPLGFGR